MSKFEKSEWSRDYAAREFIDHADYYLVERKEQIKILKSYYKFFILKRRDKKTKVLDLGCGDGFVFSELLKTDKNIEGTLIDGSKEMLNNARERLKDFNNMTYLNKTFQEILSENVLKDSFDFVMSSLAIHHLEREEKKLLFKLIYDILEDKGCFINLDVVLSVSEDIERWYLDLWEEWIAEKEKNIKLEESYTGIPNQYKNNPDNFPDTLDYQLNALRECGFKNVDCFYKYGIFAIYAGQK
jgi:tRNA (cmo5U34)-methyltransferase